MIYDASDSLLIRDMEERDAKAIADGERAQGWNATEEKYLLRLRDRAEGKCISLVAESGGAAIGYINIYPNSQWGAFAGKGLPEIVDFGVLETYRRRGIGMKLMDAAEKIASEYADTVYLGVGLHSGYGAAQRMYIRRGYLPDGSGAWYRDAVCPPYGECLNDDDLVLYLSKKLR